MLHFLGLLAEHVSFLNVFRYITFRTAGATITAIIFVFLFGPTIIAALRVRQGKGQPIREDGPQSHLLTKKGTPTMGGLMILSGFLVFSDRVAYPVYFSMPRHSALSVLDDQQLAGALMWTVATIVYLVAGGILSARLLFPQGASHPRGVGVA